MNARTRYTRLHMAAATIALGAMVTTGSAWGQQVFAYPQKGQSPQQQQQDQGECHGWALQNSGYNPAAGAGAPPPPPQQGQVVGGAARGAALGAVGGAIAGDAGKGAAIGAGTGAVFGGMKRNQQNRDYQAQVSAQQSQAAAQQSNYNRAYAACLQGRGYTVQ